MLKSIFATLFISLGSRPYQISKKIEIFSNLSKMCQYSASIIGRRNPTFQPSFPSLLYVGEYNFILILTLSKYGQENLKSHMSSIFAQEKCKECKNTAAL